MLTANLPNFLSPPVLDPQAVKVSGALCVLKVQGKVIDRFLVIGDMTPLELLFCHFLFLDALASLIPLVVTHSLPH